MGRRQAGPPRGPVVRLRGGDRMQWESDLGPFPQHLGAVLLLDDHAVPPEAWVDTLARRLGTVPALGRRPLRPPLGGGPWIWCDDDRDPAAHVGVTVLGSDRPGPARASDGDTAASRGDPALLDAVAGLVATRLPRGRSPWRARVLVDRAGRARALAVVLHHVLADGFGGLAVLAALVDGVPAADPGPAVPLPAYPDLVRDAWRERVAALRRLPATATAVREGLREMGWTADGRAPRTPLNRPTGPRRDLAARWFDLDTLRSTAHVLGGTVNDLLLVAAAATFADLLPAGSASHLLVSVPVAVDDPAVLTAYGAGAANTVGVVPMPVPVTGPMADRVRRVAAERARRLAGTHGRSLPVVLASFRVLSALGLVEAFATRQRLVNTLVTNVRGPAQALRVGGVRVRDVIPVVPNQGNIAVSFAALSYAGRLCVTAASDPDASADAGVVMEGLAQHLASLTDLAG